MLMNHEGLEVREWNPAERVVEEMRLADELEPRRRSVEQAVESLRGALAVGQHDQLRTLLVDDPRQLGNRSEAAEIVGRVVDRADDRERRVAVDLDRVRDRASGLDVPTTSTRRLPTTRWATDSQTVVSANTDSVRARIVDVDIPSPGTQSATAETPTIPVVLPTAVRTAGPSVKWTAVNALRSETSQTTVRSDDAARRSPTGRSGTPSACSKEPTRARRDPPRPLQRASPTLIADASSSVHDCAGAVIL